jgi:hypothetical protein
MICATTNITKMDDLNDANDAWHRSRAKPNVGFVVVVVAPSSWLVTPIAVGSIEYRLAG